MVVYNPAEETVNGLFHALSDATRRDIVRRCALEATSVSRLAGPYPMSFAAVQKHVAVLERAGLVSKERRGREQIVHADREALRKARQAVERLEALWRYRVARMDDLLAEREEVAAPEERKQK